MEFDPTVQIIIRHPDRDPLDAVRNDLALPNSATSLRQIDLHFDKRWELSVTVYTPEEWATIFERIHAATGGR